MPCLGMMGSMEQYYIATEDGKTEGPYALGMLKTLYTHGKITKDALVCIAGGQEWVKFGTVLEQEKNAQACKKNECISTPEDQPEEKPYEYPEPLAITIEGLFRVVGVVVLIASIILLVYSIEKKNTELGFIYLFSGVVSCLWCFWCAKVSGLLFRAVDLLSVIAKRLYNVGNED